MYPPERSPITAAGTRIARALLSSSPQGTCDYAEADLRDTAAIVRAAARTVDLGAPVALMLLIIGT